MEKSFEQLKENDMEDYPFLPALIEKREIIDGGTGEMRKEYDVTVVLNGNNKLPVKTFSSIQNIHYSEHWDECCDAELSLSQKRRLKVFLQKQAANQTFKKIIYISGLGFAKRYPDLYVYDRLNYFWRKCYDLEVCADENLPIMETCTEVELNALLTGLGSFIDLLPGITDVLMSLTLYSVIAPILDRELGQRKFLVYIYGESGVHKTTLAKLFFTDTDNKQVKNFTIHRKSEILKLVQDFTGHAVLVDDYHPLTKKYDREKQESILDMIARNENNGSNALTVVTGEFLEGCFSLQDRMIQIEVPRLCNSIHAGTFYDKLTQCQQNRKILRMTEILFLERFFENYDENSRYLKNELSNVLGKYDGYRIEGNTQYLLVTAKLFEKLIPEMLRLEFSQKLADSIMKICERQKKHMEKIHLIEANEWVTIIRKILDQESEALVHRPSEKGWFQEIVYENGRCYIPRIWLKSKLETFCRKKINMKELIDDMESKGILLTDQSSAKTKKIGGHRYYVIDIGRLRNSVQ